MHLSDLTSFLIILVSVADQISSQDSPQGTCHVWADPHLVMFPVDPAQQGMRASYWCQTPGRVLILKNKYVEVYVSVTDAPYWNEEYEIKLIDNSQAFCTITHGQSTCSNAHVDVVQIGAALEILYYDADNLSISVISYPIDNHIAYDIMITQSYRITSESFGLCVTKSPSCRLENAANPFGRRRRQNVGNTNATQVCDEYMKQAYKTAKDYLGNTGSSMTDHARVACIKDVTISGNPAWGESAVNFVTMDALKETQMKPKQRHEMFKTIIPTIAQAVSRAKESIHRWKRPDLPNIILT